MFRWNCVSFAFESDILEASAPSNTLVENPFIRTHTRPLASHKSISSFCVVAVESSLCRIHAHISASHGAYNSISWSANGINGLEVLEGWPLDARESLCSPIVACSAESI